MRLPSHSPLSSTAAAPGRFMTYPDIHGDTIVFTYEGDLWTVPAAGGIARRLTTHPGTEDFSRISPDGRTVAFTGQYDGAAIYTIPLAGGAPSRVTYQGSGVRAVAWTPDGKKIVFRSGHENTFRPIVKLYTVSPAGELSEPMPMDRGILASYSPDGTKLAYNRRGNEEYYWKRYKGGQYPDIWL
jgi:tricorn protease